MLKIRDEESEYAYGKKVRIWLSHYAHRVWPQSHYGSFHLYGHSHGNLPDDERSLSFDVGIDVLNAPISYNDVVERMKSKKWIRPEGRRDEKENL